MGPGLRRDDTENEAQCSPQPLIQIDIEFIALAAARRDAALTQALQAEQKAATATQECDVMGATS